MTDYSDWKVWKEVELYTHERYFNEYQELQPEELAKVFEDMISEAWAEGLEGCYLKFRSTYEQYEDYLGPVAVTACGYRKLNNEEIAETQKDEKVRTLAKEMGVTEYEARIVCDLKERGKL